MKLNAFSLQIAGAIFSVLMVCCSRATSKKLLWINEKMSKIWFSTDNLEKNISSDWSELLKDGSNTKAEEESSESFRSKSDRRHFYTNSVFKNIILSSISKRLWYIYGSLSFRNFFEVWQGSLSICQSLVWHVGPRWLGSINRRGTATMDFICYVQQLQVQWRFQICWRVSKDI